MPKLVFSGHDSFPCRQLWLKKGYDYVIQGNSFQQEDAVVKLGVGKNMVSSIRYWMKAFNIIDNSDLPTQFGKKLFDDVYGYDPYLEDQASLWLLHYQLVKNNYASIYSIIFNELRKEKLFFTRESFVKYVIRRESPDNQNINSNTLAKDFTVFTNLYKNDVVGRDMEESSSNLLAELEIVAKSKNGKEDEYQIENNERNGLPMEVVLFAIGDNENFSNSISLHSIENERNSPGSIFAMNRTGILNKIGEVVNTYSDITYTDHAGVKELQFKSNVDPYQYLDSYYEK